MKNIRLLVSILALALAGCTAIPSTSTVSDKTARIVAQLPRQVATILTPVLQHNPKYAPDVLLLSTAIPSLLQNGRIDAASIANALFEIPYLTAQERADLVYVQVGLSLALDGYAAYTGQTVVLYTDPNVSAIVNAFCSGLASAAKAIPSS